MAETAALAFDAESRVYDEGFGRNPVGLVFRHVFQERLRALFRPGSRVLDLGCGTGEDAIFLAGLGVRVHALDAAPGMVERARAKARERGLAPEALVIEARVAEDVGELPGPFDGASSNFGALNCADLRRVGAGLAGVLRPGAPVVLSLMGPSPLPQTLKQLLTGRGERRGSRDPRVSGIAVPTGYPTVREAQALLGPAFVWRDVFALGVLLPDPSHEAWAQEHPQAFGILAAVEGSVRRWPALRALGDHVVLEGLRR
jgi:SAM-dependent methyltransferase